MIHAIYHFFLTRKPTATNGKLHAWFMWQIYKFLKVGLMRYYTHIDLKGLGVDQNSPIIVSMTSFPARIDVVYLAIRSILNQTKKPSKIILWLAAEQFPEGEKELPKTLMELKPKGLHIQFCEDIKAHKKYFFSFQQFPKDLIVTVDDDVIYPENLLDVLFRVHEQHPNCVVANRVRLMDIKDGNFTPYRQWKINKLTDMSPSKLIFSTGVGGVLYQPDFFPKQLFDIEGIKKTQCMNDDIWLKAGQVLNNVSVVYTDFYYKPFIEIADSQKESLYSNNVFNNDNDRQLVEVFEHFNIGTAFFE